MNLDFLRAEDFVPLEKHFVYTYDTLVKVFPLTLLYVTGLTRVNLKTTNYSR